MFWFVEGRNKKAPRGRVLFSQSLKMRTIFSLISLIKRLEGAYDYCSPLGLLLAFLYLSVLDKVSVMDLMTGRSILPLCPGKC